MIVFLRIAFSLVFVTMAVVTLWASRQVALWETPREVFAHPWFIATLFDTYFAFLTFWAWVAYKETTHLARAAWLIAILGLGNLAISAYLLIQLWKLPPGASLAQLLVRK